MKKTFINAACAACMALLATSCGTIASGIVNNANGTSSSTTTGSTENGTSGILGGIFGGTSSGSTIGNVIGSVLGLDKLSPEQLVGTWRYKGPGCAFTSDNALAKAGGEVAAAKVKEKLSEQYSKLGLSSSNTFVTFNSDGTYSAQIGGKALNGTYTYSESDGKLEMKTMLLSLSGYAKKNSDGIGVLFESKKVLTLLQTLAAVSGNTTISAIGDLSKNYDGVRVGFDMTK